MFAKLGLAEPLLRAVSESGYDQPTPIQSDTIPPLLDGRDVLGCAQTGTGKTAAFALPILQLLDQDGSRPEPRGCRALILTPTRELAAQIGDSLKTYGRHLKLRHTVVYGGVGQNPQVKAMRQGVDILVATPGRLLDLIQQGHIRLGGVRILVLDEADRMLDMGFLPDVKRVLAKLPDERQSMLFSATMPDSIRQLAGTLLDDAEEVSVAPPATTVERIDQRVMFVERNDKRSLLRDMVLDLGIERALVFCRTKHGANRLAKQLSGQDGLDAEAIHGGKSQSARERALDSFRDGRTRLLIATDVLARGMDIDGITHVINFDLPNEPESYVHRIGRTARAGADGIAVSFCDADQQDWLADIEKLTKIELRPVDDQPYHAARIMDSYVNRGSRTKQASAPKKSSSKRRRGSRSRAAAR